MIATALAAKSFGVITIHSGSQYQNAGLSLSGSEVAVGSGKYLELVLNDDGSLADKVSGKYLNVKDGEKVSLTSTAQKGFSISSSALTYDGHQLFEVCSSKLAYGDACSDGVGVALRVVSEESSDNYYPGSSSASSSATSTSTTSTNTPTTLVTKTASTTTAATSTAAGVTAGKKFGVIAIHSGSDVQNAGIKQVPEHPHVFSVGGTDGSDLYLSFQDDKTSLVDGNGRGVNVDSNTGEIGSVAPFGRAPATTGFSISEDGDLSFDESEGFYACPSGKAYSLSNKSCEGGISIALKVIYA